MDAIFITGTDTDIGKTFVATRLIALFNEKGFATVGIKPIASGCERDNNSRLVNTDALALQKVASIKCAYDIVNPMAFEEPIAPHIAAGNSGGALSKIMMMQKITDSIQLQADLTIIEGAGGWLVPLNDKESMADVVCALNIPVILVVGIKLGCLNHAILTSRSIIQSGVPFLGWIANCLDPKMLAMNENIETLKQWIAAPLLGRVPYGVEQALGQQEIDIDLILERLFTQHSIT